MAGKQGRDSPEQQEQKGNKMNATVMELINDANALAEKVIAAQMGLPTGMTDPVLKAAEAKVFTLVSHLRTHPAVATTPPGSVTAMVGTAVLAFGLLLTGCAGPTASVVETLAVDAAVSIGLPAIAQADPTTVPAIQDAYVALNGVVNGANTNSASQVLALIGLKAQNPAVSALVSNVVAKLSIWEQDEVGKLGTNQWGTIVLAEARTAVAAWPANLQ
jgi:hypothetical protein